MLQALSLIFCISIVLSALGVVFSKNPIHSVIYLVYTFLNASALLFCYNIEFIGIILVVVYVGAIAVLFLFVIMLLNIRLIEFNEDLKKYIPISMLIGASLIMIMNLMFRELFTKTSAGPQGGANINYIDYIHSVSNTQLIGQSLYTEYSLHFILASIVLLVAMVGAIFLTYRSTQLSKKQNISKQIARTKKMVINYF